MYLNLLQTKLHRLIACLVACLVIICTMIGAEARAELIRIGYLHEQVAAAPALSNLDERPADLGLAGATLAIQDNASSGRFVDQQYELLDAQVAIGGNTLAAAAALIAQGAQYLLLDVSGQQLQLLSEAYKDEEVLLFNVSNADIEFRQHYCQANLLHSALSRDMKTDALAQFLMKKRWREWFVVVGSRAADERYAAALKRSAKKFGGKIIATKQWTGQHDLRRTAQQEIPAFTKDIEYDVLLVADEIGDFGNYLLFQTWEPKLVAGTQGLVAQAWGRAFEQWGAAQLQERFLAQFNRTMRADDYAAWVAARSVAEAALRTGSTQYPAILQYIRSDEFELAGYKGRKLNYRQWNGQLRQPVPLLWSQSVVAQAPLEGYLHQRTELDTLGLDEPQSQCQ